MKKNYFVAIFLTLATLCSCSKEMQEQGVAVEGVETELAIGLPIEVSRTAIDAEGRASWTEGDTFALWAKRKSASSYELNGSQFSMKYYWDSYQSAVFTSKVDALAEDEYTYYAVSPQPSSINGQQAKYILPVIQQGGSFNSAYDIMFATPIVAEALSEAELNTLSLNFEHKMHVLKVAIAENNLGTNVSQLQFTFPKNVTGSVTVNATSGITSMSGGSPNLTIDIPEGATVGDAVWGVIYPNGTISGNVKLVAIGDDGRKSVEKTFAFSKKCEAGHITPLALTVPNPLSTLRFTIGTNNLGEKIENLTIIDNNGTKLALTKLSDTVYDYITNSDSATVFDSYKGKTFTVTYESANAIVTSTFTMPTTLSTGMNKVPALTVPYLFFEDFSCIHTAGESYGDNGVAADERNQPGVSLDGYMSHKGWNAARFLLGVGTCPRINVRYQVVNMVMIFGSYHHGRLDTPTLSNLKDGASVKLRVQFDAGGVEYNGDFSGQEIVSLGLASHTNTTNPIDGIPTGTESFSHSHLGPVEFSTTLNDFGTTYAVFNMESKYTTSSFGDKFPTYTTEMYEMTNSSRICFYPFTSMVNESMAYNNECAIYVDNIRVSIISE